MKDVGKLQRYLDRKCPGQYRIAVFEWERMGKVLFKGRWPAEKELPILLHGGHFEPVLRTSEIFKVFANDKLVLKMLK